MRRIERLPRGKRLWRGTVSYRPTSCDTLILCVCISSFHYRGQKSSFALVTGDQSPKLPLQVPDGWDSPDSLSHTSFWNWGKGACICFLWICILKMKNPVTVVLMQLHLRSAWLKTHVSRNQPGDVTQPSAPRSWALNWPHLHHLLISLACGKVFSSDINKLKTKQDTHTTFCLPLIKAFNYHIKEANQITAVSSHISPRLSVSSLGHVWYVQKLFPPQACHLQTA